MTGSPLYVNPTIDPENYSAKWLEIAQRKEAMLDQLCAIPPEPKLPDGGCLARIAMLLLSIRLHPRLREITNDKPSYAPINEALHRRSRDGRRVFARRRPHRRLRYHLPHRTSPMTQTSDPLPGELTQLPDDVKKRFQCFLCDKVNDIFGVDFVGAGDKSYCVCLGCRYAEMRRAIEAQLLRSK